MDQQFYRHSHRLHTAVSLKKYLSWFNCCFLIRIKITQAGSSRQTFNHVNDPLAERQHRVPFFLLPTKLYIYKISSSFTITEIHIHVFVINYQPLCTCLISFVFSAFIKYRHFNNTMKPTVFLTRTDVAPIGIDLLKAE